MKLTAVITTISALALGAQAAPAIDRRGDTDEIARFRVGSEWNCANTKDESVFTKAEATSVCTSFLLGTKSVTVIKLNPKCQVFVYNSAGCVDSGVPVGIKGCYSNGPEISAYRVFCPWW
ncbi:hypothetical protein B0T25DRAFT_519916 [Lasiosphaeria hispida]|uniref:Uncharacterized protein n=1 Tax=Lasiosphaeria hispida TaxID=260671 RepID=A0AAJ0MCN0_9PEZI|nr:hypothetical protein B0T25DRAFT_519916 [Lasiosphaeria hispida]